MKTYTFFGYSDDVFAYEIDGKDVDEIGCYDSMAIFKLADPSTVEDEGLFVCGQYAVGEKTGGAWMVGIMLIDEDVPIPADWTLSYGCEDYSPRLSIAVPDDITCEAWPPRGVTP